MLSVFPETHAAGRAVRMARRGVTPTFELDALGDELRDQLVDELPAWFNRRQGWIYLAANEAWPSLLKVGCTRKGVPARMQALSGAGVPTPWLPRAVWSVYDAHGLEAACHAACAPYRRRGELFEADQDALEHLIRRAMLADKAAMLTHLASLLLPGQLHDLLGIEQLSVAAGSPSSDVLPPIHSQVKPNQGGSI